MARPGDIENLRPLFKKIMQTHQLKTQDVKTDRSHIAVSDKGEFHCANCVHTWQSAFSWITFNLRELEIEYRWRMKCKVCIMPCIPTFTITQLESMFEKVVRFYKGETLTQDTNIGYSGRRTFRQPHLPELCEKCRWGLEQCWTRKLHY